MSLSDTPRAERHKEFLTNCHYAQSRPGALLNSYKIHSNFTETFEDARYQKKLSPTLGGFLAPPLVLEKASIVPVLFRCVYGHPIIFAWSLQTDPMGKSKRKTQIII